MNKRNNVINKINHKFILFFILSIVFWFMTKLSKEYESTLNYKLSYNNLPTDKLLQEKPPEFLNIRVKASGFKLLLSKFSPSKIEIDCTNLLIKSPTNYYLLLSQQKLSIQKQMKTGVELKYFVNDSIQFNLGLLKVKKVPVKLLSNFSYLPGYELNKAIVITPDSTILTGPESIIDSIEFVSTKILKKLDINDSFIDYIDINQYSSKSNIKIAENKVTVSLSVDKFTEGFVEVPFKIINLPEGKTINTFPKHVKITYRVALSNFSEIDNSSFLIVCDYNMSEQNNLPYLIPKIVESSSLTKNARMAPLKIDFIINK
tara:strand:+ start:12013 stop:12963 length:951 start_codon:yes stop_codon:yes gene_type:complete